MAEIYWCPECKIRLENLAKVNEHARETGHFAKVRQDAEKSDRLAVDAETNGNEADD